jgi:hypothetical protein
MSEAESGYEMIRKIAEHESEKLHLLEYGRVESVNIHESESDGMGYACSVLLVGRTTDEGEMLKLENVPIAASFMGMIDVPKIDDLVLIAYINGDFELPIILGRLYSKERPPPLYEDGIHLWEISKDGFGDAVEQSKLKIVFTDADQTTLEFDDTQIIIDIGGNINIKIDKQTLTLDVAGNTITASDDGSLKLDFSSDIEIKSAANIKLEASGNLEIKGAKIDLNP